MLNSQKAVWVFVQIGETEKEDSTRTEIQGIISLRLSNLNKLMSFLEQSYKVLLICVLLLYERARGQRLGNKILWRKNDRSFKKNYC